MPDDTKRLKSILFDNRAHVSTDYTLYVCDDIKPPIRTEYIEKPTCYRIRPPPLKYTRTLENWTSYVPFDLSFQRKDIVHTDPRVPQKPYKELVDEEREQVVKTRPRLVMTPACSIDAFEDERLRKEFIDHIYTTSAMRMSQQGAANWRKNKIISPLQDRPAPVTPLALPTLRPPYVSPEWRMDSITWDDRQLRTYCRPDTEFWLKRVPPAPGHHITNINF